MTATATETLTQHHPHEPAEPAQLHELAIESLTTAADNPRRDLGDLTELAMSIKTSGIIEPIIATTRPVPGDDDLGVQVVVVAGHRRLAAAELAGLDTVPVILRAMDETERISAMLVENLQRSDLAPLEEAAAFRRLVDEFGMTQRALSETVGRSQGHISKRLALLDLPAKIHAALDSGGITISDAVELSKLAATPDRLEAAFKQGQSWRGHYARAVEDQLDEQKLAEEIAKVTQELEQTGAKIVAYKRDNYGYLQLPNGMLPLDSWQARDLKLTPANHKNQPCHAVAVSPRDAAVVQVCTKPASHKGKTLETPPDEKEKARKQRETEKRAQLRARETNLELGRHLAAKLAAPAIDATNMRLIADLLIYELGSELAQTSLRYTDEASQTVITKKDGTTSRVVHVEGRDAVKLIHDRLAAATTPEEIMGALLQTLLTSKLANRKAVPASQRYGYVAPIEAGPAHIKKALDKIAASVGKSTRVTRSA